MPDSILTYHFIIITYACWPASDVIQTEQVWHNDHQYSLEDANVAHLLKR